MSNSTVSIAQALTRANELTSETPRLDAEVLLAEALGRDRTYLYTWPEKVLSQSQLQQFNAWFERRRKGEPVAYIVGRKDFWSLSLEVSPCTLIPRPDTECLVEAAVGYLHDLSRLGPQPPRVLDLGTGTGAIALSLAKEFPRADVVGVDVSADAVALAQRNAKSNAIANCSLVQSNWFEAVTGCFDLIVSNPPYIGATDPHLKNGDLCFEPSSALIALNDGLADLQYIIASALDYLRPGGLLLLEHGWQQAAQVAQMLSQFGYEHACAFKDYGGHIRVSGGYKPK